MATVLRNIMSTYCVECDATFSSEDEKNKHSHVINTLDSGDFLLLIPNSVQTGTWEAAQAMTKAINELKDKHPDKKFQFVPFAYSGSSVGNSGTFNQGTYALLAIVENK